MVGLYKYNQNKEKFKPLKGALMKKSKERFLSFTLSSKTRAASMKIAMTLTAAAVFAMSPVVPAVVGTEITVQAAEYKDSTDANIKFTVNEDGKTATITEYTGSASSLTIPETVSYGGTTYTVTAIGTKAFGNAHGTTDLSTTEIVIPGTVKTIGYSAFEGSSSIKKITIGEGVQSIGERAFYGLTGLTEISFPESVVYIGPSVCENNASLKTVTIAGELFEYDFGSGAFSGCTSLETVNITGSVDQIPDEAFSGCENLSSLTLAEGITRIGSDAFYGCKSLQTISLPSTVKFIGSSAFYGSGLTEIVVPENVTEIEMSAFAECKALESVTINGRITEIPTSLFENCTKLKTVKLPVGITSIGSSAFSENNSLTNIAIGRSGVSDYTLIIPDTVTSIKQYAFYSEGGTANKFKYVDMGSGVSSLGANAFNGFKTTTVITSKALKTISNYAFHNTGAENVYITRVPENKESTVVNMDAFSGCSIKELYLPSSVSTKNALKSDCFEGSKVSDDGKVRVIPKIYTDASATTTITLEKLKEIMSGVQDSGTWTWYVPTITDTTGTTVETVETKTLAKALPTLEGQGTADSAETVAVTSVSLNKSSIELAVGDTKTLTKTISPSNATISNVEWTSSNPNVVAVSANGRIRGISAGKATITVTTDDGAKTATCTVTVSGEVSKVSVTGVSLDKPALELTEGDTTTLTATVTPDNATNTDVTWSSNNPSVATVDAEGNITAVAAGTATITVTTVDEEMTATCVVTVTAKTTEIENFVDRLYTNLLNQSVNATEKASYVNSLSAKTTTAAEVVADFALDGSIADISNEEFVSRMYSAVFNRKADDGKVNWENLLDNGMSRKIIIQKFTESDEFKNICASCGMTQGKYESDEIRDSNIYVTSFVNNLYLTILWRTPDAAGINNFVGALLNGASTDGIIKEFILGAECTSKNYKPEEFIIACFGGILGRTGPNVDEIDGGRLFLDTLNAGTSREEIVDSLLNSEEYKNRLKAIGLTK
jgi:uncharacterized protein YjdB